MTATITFYQFLRGEGCSEAAAAASVRLVRVFVEFVVGRTNQLPKRASERDVEAFLQFVAGDEVPDVRTTVRVVSKKGCLNTLGAYFRYLGREDLAFHTCLLWEGTHAA